MRVRAADGPVPGATPDPATQFAMLERRLGGASEIAVVPVGPRGQVRDWCRLTGGVAWSAIKVPLVVAACGRTATVLAAVLRDSGDSRTMIQARRVRAGCTPFGQTVWPLLARQAPAAADRPTPARLR